jgi:hypothetical protein
MSPSKPKKPEAPIRIVGPGVTAYLTHELSAERQPRTQAELRPHIELAKEIFWAHRERDYNRFYELIESKPLDPVAVDFLIFISRGNAVFDSDRMHKLFFQENGAHSGGKAKNPHKSEAIELYKIELPKARSNNQAHERVREKLAAKYRDPPTVRTIRDWCK